MRRRILHIIPFLWSGAGQVVTRLCEEQARLAEVHIATSGRLGAEVDWPGYRRRLRQAGVKWHCVNTFHRAAESFWPAVEHMARLLQSLSPQVVHAHAGVPTLVAALARKRARRTSRIVAQMYSWGLNRPSWMDTMDLIGFSRADVVVVSARRYERLLLAGGVCRSNLSCVSWGIDLPPRGFTSRPGNSLRLGFVGRLEPRKDQATLIEAFAHLVTSGLDARLALIGPDGDPAYAAALRQRAEKPDLKGRVEMPGEVGSVWPYLAGMDLFVSFSSDEGQGLAVLEAMAAGVPVAAIPAAGIEDFLRDGRNGLLLRGRRVEDLGNELARALSDPARLRELANCAARMVRRRFTWQTTLRSLEKVYGC